MTGRSSIQDDSQHLMMEIADHVHELRVAEARAEGRPPKREETLFMAMLVANAAIGDAIVGSRLAEAAGLDKAGVHRFRRWLLEILSMRN